MGINKSPGGPSQISSFRISSAELDALFGLHNALDRADSHALRRVMVAFAFNTGGLIDHIQNAVALADRLGGALRDACPAGDAFFSDFHGHGKLLLSEISYIN